LRISWRSTSETMSNEGMVGVFLGGGGRIRTCNQAIMSRLL